MSESRVHLSSLMFGGEVLSKLICLIYKRQIFSEERRTVSGFLFISEQTCPVQMKAIETAIPYLWKVWESPPLTTSNDSWLDDRQPAFLVMTHHTAFSLGEIFSTAECDMCKEVKPFDRCEITFRKQQGYDLFSLFHRSTSLEINGPIRRRPRGVGAQEGPSQNRDLVTFLLLLNPTFNSILLLSPIWYLFIYYLKCSLCNLWPLPIIFG